jgi:RNA recognition motif-containing protein
MESDNVKLWVGNLDTKLTEFQLLKILEKFGKICSFDYLYHITDRGGRTPRGYAFVTFVSAASAVEAIKGLHNKKVLSKELVVRYATPKSDSYQTISKPIPAALKAGNTSKKLSEDERLRKIKQLEEKLNKMQNSQEEDFKIKPCSTSRSKPY